MQARDRGEIVFTVGEFAVGCQHMRGHAGYLTALGMVGRNAAVTASVIQRLRGSPQLRGEIVTSRHVRKRTGTAVGGRGSAPDTDRVLRDDLSSMNAVSRDDRRRTGADWCR